MNRLKNIIISPSGNFYGSEQVLFDHLSSTSKRFLVFFPKNSIFEGKIKLLNKHEINTFKNIVFLYIRLIFMILSVNVKNVYVNEAGHIKYVKLLSLIFPNVKFIVHVRLKEDTSKSRLGINIGSNLKLICVSNYILNLVNMPKKTILIYDPIQVLSTNKRNYVKSNKIEIGIIGRVTPSKGLKFIDSFLKTLISYKFFNDFVIHFYGDVELHIISVKEFYMNYSNPVYPNIIFHGFVNNQDTIYETIDAVVHLNPEEPLGRIGLESWSRNIPFYCFNSGGCFEINSLLDQNWFILDNKQGWEKQLISKLTNFNKMDFNFNRVKSKLINNFSINSYIRQVESLFLK